MEKYLVSIIVPIYNSEGTLHQCIDSILEQTYKRIELILVNDGSSDSSESICRKYESKDTRVFYYKKENGGVSSARNFGISVARGDYITFVDSDDWLDKEGLKKIISAIDECEPEYVIPRSRMVLYDSHSNFIEERYANDDYDMYINERDLDKYFYELFTTSAIYSVCGRLYKKEFLIKNNILFDTNIHLLEDFLFNLVYIKKCKSIQHTCVVLYNIRIINIENYKYKRGFEEYFNGISKIKYELFELLYKKNISLQKEYYDMVMNYWLIAIDNVMHSDEGLLNKIKQLKYIAVEVDKENIFSFCTKQNVDTHYKVLFKTQKASIFYMIRFLKNVKKILLRRKQK